MLKSTTQKFDDFLNCLVRYILRFCFVHLRGNSGSFLQSLDVLVHDSRRDLLNLQIPYNGVDVVGDQRVLAVVHGYAPPLFTIERNKVQKELRNGLIGGREKSSRELLILHLRLTLQCVLVGSAGLPFLPGLTVLVRVVVDYRIVLFAFDDRCHSVTSFLLSHIE